MHSIANGLKFNCDVAFSHCISGDFTNPRNMSAGVAVPLRKTFGRPKKSDLLNDYLTFQSYKKGAALYGLVTKPIFNGKPQIKDYDTAFRKLTDDFELKAI